MKRQTLWWIVGGAVVIVGGGTAIYFATRKKTALPAAGDSKALAPAPKPASAGTSNDTAPVLPGTRPQGGVEAALSTATSRIGNSIDWAAALAEGTPR